MAEAVERPVSTMTVDTLYAVANIPLPSSSDDDIREPRAPHLASSSDPLTSNSQRESAYLNNSETLLGNKEIGAEDSAFPITTTSPKSKRRSAIRIALLLVALALIIIAVIVPVYFTVIKPRSNVANSNTSGGGGGSGPTSSGPGGSKPSPGSNAITGGDGSTIHAADGTTFIYNNSFGGFCKCFTDFILFAQLETIVYVTITDHISSRG